MHGDYYHGDVISSRDECRDAEHMAYNRTARARMEIAVLGRWLITAAGSMGESVGRGAVL